jgi:3-phenylpropionate/trans-cinnamate dioxygenase ferredoxin reductase subunit
VQKVTAAVVVVGAGHAGVALVAALQRLGYAGAIVLIDGQSAWPYQRPPLSKALLTDDKPQPLLLRAEGFFSSPGLDWVRGDPVTRLEMDARRVILASGRAVPYDRLVLATGAQPRCLSWTGIAADACVSLGNLDDSLKLRARLREISHMTVVGGGFIGLEAAAAGRRLGVAVDVVEQAPRLLARVCSATFSTRVAELHRERGVSLHCNAHIAGLTAELSAAEKIRVCLANGSQWHTDLLLIGIGSVPRDELALAAGLACDNGVIADASQTTSDPHVLAIGDCARSFSPLYKRHVRFESVQAANEQARVAAATLCGAPRPASEVPWFWSDQHDARLQMTGWLPAAAASAKAEPPASSSFSLDHHSEQRLTAVESWNDPAGHVKARTRIAAAHSAGHG